MEPEYSLLHSQQTLLVPVLSYVNPIPNFSPHFSGIHSNIIFLSSPRSPKLSLLLMFSMCATFSAYLVLLEFIALKIFGKAYKL
jgi:hypothetical protein